jgi:hypothetical protein
LQGFPNEEIKSEILDMVCTMRSSENLNEDNVEEWPSDTCELCFRHLRDMNIVSAIMKQMGEEEVGLVRVKKVSAIAWHYPVLTLK